MKVTHIIIMQHKTTKYKTTKYTGIHRNTQAHTPNSFGILSGFGKLGTHTSSIEGTSIEGTCSAMSQEFAPCPRIFAQEEPM